MRKKIWLIVEIFLWLLLIIGNAGAFYLLKMQESGGKTVEADGNSATLPDGTVFTAKNGGAVFEIELKNGKKAIHCASNGEQWHCTGIWNGGQYEFLDDGKANFYWKYGNVSVTDFNYDHVMDIKTDGGSNYIFANGEWLKCTSWDLGDTKTALASDGKTYRWTGAMWQEQKP